MPQVDLDNDEKIADGAISFEPELRCQTKSDQACAAPQSPLSVQPANADPVLPHALESSDVENGLECGVSCGSRLPLFELGKVLGSGGYGKVYEATCGDGKKVAVKFILEDWSDWCFDIDGHSDLVLVEVAMLHILGKPPLCPNVIKLHGWIKKKYSHVLVMEYLQPCCTLYDHNRQSANINERKARYQFIHAVKYCFDLGVFHGDLHTGNILVTHPTLELKLIDFGCAFPIYSKGEDNYSKHYIGARLYTPPEILSKPRFHAGPAYVWAVGVVLFEILHGYAPFKDRTKILSNCFSMKKKLSSECRDLLFQCLRPNPADRLMLQHIEDHSWFKN